MSDQFLSTKLSTFMNYLSDFNPTIEQNDDIYKVIYTSEDHNGYCTYQKYKPLSRFQQGDILQMTECNMVDIVAYINKKSPLNEGDLTKLQMEIRTDSLNRLKEFVKHRGYSNLHTRQPYS